MVWKTGRIYASPNSRGNRDSKGYIRHGSISSSVSECIILTDSKVWVVLYHGKRDLKPKGHCYWPQLSHLNMLEYWTNNLWHFSIGNNYMVHVVQQQWEASRKFETMNVFNITVILMLLYKDNIAFEVIFIDWHIASVITVLVLSYNKLASVFHMSVLLLILNFVITLSK